MIDIHTHILPGIDDGPQTIEESIEILRKAADAGIGAIVATPHVLEMPSETAWQGVRDTFNSLKQMLILEKIDIELILGAELFISPDLPQKIKENRELTINNGNKYVLLELPLQEIPSFTDQTIFELLVNGIIPIISHPERYLEIQRNPRKLFNLEQKGVLTQVNAGSLSGRYGKKAQKTAKTLFAHNLIHMMGSDVHSTPNGSYPLSQGMNIAADIVGIKRAQEMVMSIPKKIMSGEIIEFLPAKPIKNSTFRKLFR